MTRRDGPGPHGPKSPWAGLLSTRVSPATRSQDAITTTLAPGRRGMGKQALLADAEAAHRS